MSKALAQQTGQQQIDQKSAAVISLIPQDTQSAQIAAVAHQAQVLKVQDLRVELRNTHEVISGINFHLRQGEILGLVGESGSGKTTLATALLAHARKGAVISGGQVLVDGISLLSISGEALRRARGSVVGYVPQDPAMALNPALLIGMQLRETLQVHEAGLTPAQQQERLQQTMRDVGLPTEPEFLQRFAHQLSGGQQQRVLLALAFILRPKLIVLDEPTTALDVATQAHILQTLRQLCKSQGVAAIYVSHDLAVVKDLADRVMVMYAGRIVETASRERLFSQAAHPYTSGLLAAIPDVAQRRTLSPIMGQAPSPGHRPQGCAFAPRCSQRQAACGEAIPDLSALNHEHEVACLAPLRAEDHAMQLAAISTPGHAESLHADQREILLDIQQLNIAYDRQVLFDVSLQIKRGECLALVGESGSGKTSLARALAGLGGNAQGQVLYAGQALSLQTEQRAPALRHEIQYIFQNPYRALNPRQTVAQSLAAPLVHFFGLKGDALRQRIEQALQRVSLSAALADLYPGSLSGGERQRVAIARALVCEPRLLICDEITSALDVSVQASILALLRQLQDEGLTMLFVTHDLGVVRAIADQVVVLQHGRVVEAGEVDQVLDQPAAAYTRMLLQHSPSLT